MLKLGRVRPLDIHEGSILLDHPLGDEMVHLYVTSASLCHRLIHGNGTYASQIPFHAKTLKVASAEDDGSEVLPNRLVQPLGRGQRYRNVQRAVVAESVAVNADLVIRQCPRCGQI